MVTRILAVVLMVSLAGSGAAWAKAYHAHRPRLHAAHLSTHVRRVHRVPLHRRSRLAALAAPQSDEGQPRDTARFQEAEASGPSQQPGLFKGRHEGGWGFSNGQMTTVLGLYQRPETSDAIPQNQVYHGDSRGAAGLSVSFKLGR